MKHSNVRDLTEGRPMRLLVSFAAPLLFGFLFQQLYSFVDTAIVGRVLGASKLAAVGDTGSINFLILGFCTGFCSGFSIPIAQAFGARDETSLRRYVAHAVYISAALSVVTAVLTALLCPAMLRAMNTPEEIINDSISYIRIIFAAIPFTVLYNMAGGILRSLGDSKTPVVFLVVASVANIVLDLLLIVVCGMDVAGAAVATAISQLIAGLGCVWVMIKRFPILRLSRDDRRFRPRLALKMMNIGLPMGLQYSITAIGSIMVQWSVNGLGVDAVAAVAAGSRLSMLFYCVIDALASTMATFAGQNIGARKLDRVHEGLRDSAVLGIAYCVGALAVILLLGREMLGAFVDGGREPVVMSLAAQYLRINAFFYVPLLFVNIVRFAIQGMGFTRVAMLAGLFEMIARTLVAVLLIPRLGFGAACFANPAAWVLADLFLFPCYFRVVRQLRQRFHGDTVRLTRQQAS